MKRSHLRLIEPINDPMEFSVGRLNGNGNKEIPNHDEVFSLLQLFLEWPEYASSIIRFGNYSGKIRIGYDRNLSEIVHLLIECNSECYNQLNQDKSSIIQIILEVFGITFGFDCSGFELNESFSENEPAIAVKVPAKVIRYNDRETKRTKLQEEMNLELQLEDGRNLTSKAIDVSPNSIRVMCLDVREIHLNSSVTTFLMGKKIQLSVVKLLGETLILKPLAGDPESYGPFYDFYVNINYPMLKSRYDFPVDPYPAVMIKTGQAEKFSKDISWETVVAQAQAAFDASEAVKYDYSLSYVAMNENSDPIGIAGLVNAFVDRNERPIWAFHGLGIVKDSRYLDQTCALHQVRVDYLRAFQQPEAKMVLAFNRKGKWLEKVYVKFHSLSKGETSLEVIKLNRYFRLSKERDSISQKDLPGWVVKHVDKGAFKRVMGASSCVSFGLGMPELNLSGFLNSIFVTDHTKDEATVRKDLLAFVSGFKPQMFMYEVPDNLSEPEFEGYRREEYRVADTFFTTKVSALKSFASALEHTQAVLRKRYEG